MKRYWSLVLCAAFAMGCDQNGASVQPYDIPVGINPGTRLSPKLLLADDGTIFLHPTIWKDSEFGECSFQNADDGKFRCLPNAPTQTADVYLDSSCVVRAFIYRPETCAAPKDLVLLTVQDSNACGNDVRWSLYKVTGVTSQGQTYVKTTDDKCVPSLSFPDPTSGILYVVGDKVDVSDFVSAWR